MSPGSVMDSSYPRGYPIMKKHVIAVTTAALLAAGLVAPAAYAAPVVRTAIDANATIDTTTSAFENYVAQYDQASFTMKQVGGSINAIMVVKSKKVAVATLPLNGGTYKVVKGANNDVYTAPTVEQFIAWVGRVQAAVDKANSDAAVSAQNCNEFLKMWGAVSGFTVKVSKGKLIAVQRVKGKDVTAAQITLSGTYVPAKKKVAAHVVAKTYPFGAFAGKIA
jgi:hypothetical protein